MSFHANCLLRIFTPACEVGINSIALPLLRKHFMKGHGLAQFYFPWTAQLLNVTKYQLSHTHAQKNGLRLEKIKVFVKTNTCQIIDFGI